jgi:nicotinate dehydrogenase subunit B
MAASILVKARLAGCATFWARASPLRTGHLRDPLGPETHFASESFIDEIAHAAGADPVAFRLKYVKNPRHAVIQAAADKAGWSKPPYPNPSRGKGNVMLGRGFSYTERTGTIVATADGCGPSASRSPTIAG